MRNVARILINTTVSASEFSTAISHIVGEGRLAVAVSGGADSMALMLLASDWCKQVGRPSPLVVTVDHALRENSSSEAEAVASWAAMRGLTHTTLHWVGDKKPGNIQSQARQARYELIGGWMKENSVPALLTGHTLDDHAETFLIRLARGSGLEGLSGMSAKARFPSPAHRNLTLLRPLLQFTHDRLKATLRASNQPWIEDPTNSNKRFLRARLRELAPALNEVGITTAKLASTIGHLSRANEVLREQARELIVKAAPISRWGYALLDARSFREAPSEIALRGLSLLLKVIGGQIYPPGFEQIQSVLAWICDRQDRTSGRTLNGCRLARKPDDRLLIAREEADAMSAPELQLSPGGSVVWDRRFVVEILSGAAPGPYTVRALGNGSPRILGKKAEFPPVEPNRIARALPAIWLGDDFRSVPALNAPENFVATSRFLNPFDLELASK